MKKAFETIFLLLVIFCIVIYITFYIAFNLTDQENPVNGVYRKKIISQVILRWAIRLHQIGDARYDYANDNRYTRLTVHLYYQPDETLEDGTLDRVVSEFNRIIRKPDGITAGSPTAIDGVNYPVTDEDLLQLIKSYSAKYSPFD